MVSSTNSNAFASASRSRNTAPSTARSASSEYGGCRSRNASSVTGRAVEDSTDRLAIFPGWPFPGGVSQQRRWVVRDNQRCAVEAMNVIAKLPDSKLGFEQCLSCKRSERQNDLRTDQLELTHQVRTTRDDLVRRGVAVS